MVTGHSFNLNSKLVADEVCSIV